MGKHSQFAVRFRLAVVYRMVPNLGEMLDWNTYLREAVSRSPQGFRPSEGPGRPKGMGFAIFDGPASRPHHVITATMVRAINELALGLMSLALPTLI